MTLTLSTAPALPRPRLLRDAAAVDLPTIGHIVDHGFVSLQRIAGTDPVAGRVVTVTLPTVDSTLVHFLTTLVEPGDFVVISPTQRGYAPVGGVIAASFASSGVVGVAVDGVCTDIDGIRTSGLAFYARGLSARTTRAINHPLSGGINIAVAIDDVIVHPGQIALGDENGLLFIDPAALEDVLPAARELAGTEEDIMTTIAAGQSFGSFHLTSEKREHLHALLKGARA